MKNNVVITGTIVLFEENLSDLHNTISSFLKIPIKKKLFLIDNTPTNFFEYVFVDESIEYIAIEKNIGFGAGHNRVIHKIKGISKYHLILNPDVNFDSTVIPNLIQELDKDKDLAMIAPKVLFPNGEHQYSCRRYPNFFELIARRFSLLKPIFKHKIFQGRYQDKDLTKPFYAEYLAGCFHLYKTDDFVKLKGFDERYFLYMEDVDICKKIDLLGKKKMYQPKEEIKHILKRGSSKDLKLLFRHSSSAIKYFVKWGF